MTPQQQHVNLYQKALLRRSLVRTATPGPAYVPFIGDGDLAIAHYVPRGFTVWGADNDESRVETCRQRLSSGAHKVIKADCNVWPFPDTQEPFTLADFDAYSEPYASFRAFWKEAPLADTLVLIFTDGHMQGVMRSGWLIHPSGERFHHESLRARRRVFNFYWQRTIKPWFREFIAPWRIVRTRFYTRAGRMLYWGAVVRRHDAEEAIAPQASNL